MPAAMDLNRGAWLLGPLFLLHLIPFNLLMGGSLIACVGLFRRGGNPRRLARWLGGLLPAAIGWSAIAGLLALAARRILLGPVSTPPAADPQDWPLASLLTVSVLALAASIGGRRARGTIPKRLLGASVAILALAAAALCTWAVNGAERRLMDGAQAAGAGGTWAAALGPSLVPRYIHFLLAALAFAGMFIALHGLAIRRREPEYGTWAMKAGIHWFTIPTAIQIVAGFWLLLAIPGSARAPLLGSSPGATMELAAGITLALGVLVVMTQAADARRPAAPVVAGALLLGVVLVLMTLVREIVGRGYDQAIRSAAGAGTADQTFVTVHPPGLWVVAGLLALCAAGVFWWLRRKLLEAPASA